MTNMIRSIRSVYWLACLSLFCVALMSCKAVDDATGVNNANVGESLKQPAGSLTRKELAQKLRRLAMSYLGEVPEACEQIADANPSLDQRLLALRIRVNSSDSVISIAADPDPQVALLNMVTVLTLQRMFAEERGQEFFGELASFYINAAKRMEDEVWKLASQVLDEDERTQLRELITAYRKDHPGELYVWWVRFSEFSAYKEQFSIASIGQGIVDVFVPVGSAVSGLETTSDIAERATWLAARQAMILQWRAELIYLQTLSAPETDRLLRDVERVSETIDALPQRIATEREAIFKEIENQEAALSKLIKQANETVGEVNATVKEAKEIAGQIDSTMKTAERTVGQVQTTIDKADQSIAKAKAILPETESALAQLDQTSKTLTATVQAVDALVQRFESEETDGAGPDSESAPARPFDITEYTQAAQELGKTADQLNTLVSNLDQTAKPERLDQTLDTLEGRLSALIWQAGFVLVLAGLILIAAAKLIPRRAARTPVQPAA